MPQWQQFLDGKVTGISPHLSSPVGEGMVCLQLTVLRTSLTRRVVFEQKKCIKKRDGPELDTL